MSREAILSRLKANKPPQKAGLPDIPGFKDSAEDLVMKFSQALESSQSFVFRLSPSDNFETFVKEKFPDAEKIISSIPEMPGTFDGQFHTALDFADIELAIVKGDLGVADSGAIWIPEENLPARVVPFITQHLLIVIDPQTIVPRMHQAYRAIDPGKLGFGVFISGPSKTADIEQALVVGAHGPLTLTVVLRPGAHL